MKKFSFISISLLCVFLISCSQMMGSSDGKYYHQQQSGSNAEPEPPVEEEPEEPEEPEDVNIITMFKVLGADGVIDESLFNEEDGSISDGNKLKLAKLKAVLPVVQHTELAGFKTADFKNKLIKASFTDKNVPIMHYVDGIWAKSSDEKYLSDTTEDKYIYGENTTDNTTAGEFPITEVRYHMYDGKNPFYSANGNHNSATFGGSETRLDRFIFYRFTGKGGGVAALDNMLVAVDTYTRLIFGFGKPTAFDTMLGKDNPTRWQAVEVVTTAPDGKQYKFYEYDPAGYVAADGSFVMEDWYKNNLAEATKNNTGKFDPQFTGKSPYLIELGAVGEYAVSGTLTVTAKHIKNISMTDAENDNSADDVNSPEFTYSVRYCAYNGTKPDDTIWNVLSSHMPDETNITPNDAKTIKKGENLLLGGSKAYTFTNIKDGLTLELDSYIKEIDTSSVNNLTEYEKPIILLGYDRYTQKWSPKADNNAFVRGPLEYDKNFQVGLGETKDFIVTIPAGSGEEIELCYAISWTTDGIAEEGAGQIFSAQTKNTNLDSDFVFSGSNGIYTLEYTDSTEASSYKDKTASIELSLGNLHKDAPIKVDYTVENISNGFIGYPKFNENHTSFAVITADKPTLQITVPLAYNPSNTQTGTLTLELTDESGLTLYDTNNSPRSIEISIIRNKFIPINAGVLEISNIKLKNISVTDEHQGSGLGNYDPEFTWNIKTRHNGTEWDMLSENTDAQVIKTDKTHALAGAKSYTIENPRENIQTIDFSAEIMEVDSSSDVIIKHNEPLIQFKYKPLSDSWNLTGKTTDYFTDSSNNQWEIKGITMEDAVRDKGAQTVTVSISSYIQDETGLIPKPIGWCTMELMFDVTWRNK